MQLTYQSEPNAGYAGLIADSSNRVIRTYPTLKALEFGLVASYDSASGKVKPFENNITRIQFSAVIVTDNVINMEINGVAITPVPFNTNNATSLADLATEIESNEDVESAVADASNNRVNVYKKPTSNSTIAVTNAAVTGGASQANVTISNLTDEQIIGIAVHEHKAPINGLVRYEADDAAGIMVQGAIWGQTNTNVTVEGKVYAIPTSAKMTSGTNNTLIKNAQFRKYKTGDEIAVVQVNFPDSQ